MVKSKTKTKINSNLKNNRSSKKWTLRETIENKLAKDSNQQFTSRIKLFQEIKKIHKNKSINVIKYYLKSTLVKLLENKIIVKHRDSYRLSRTYIRKKSLKVKKINSKIQKIKNNSMIKKQLPIKATKIKKPSKKVLMGINILKTKIANKLAEKKPPKKVLTSSILSNAVNSIGQTLLPQTSLVDKKKNNKKYQRVHPAIWQYYDKDKFISNRSADNWYDYDPEASDNVEDCWQKYIVNRGLNDVRSVKSGEWEYMVDFMNWSQQNIVHSAHTVRKIRRLDENQEMTKNPYLI